MTVAPPRSLDADTALEAVGVGLNGGIEGAGPNGSRGSVASLRRIATPSRNRLLGRAFTAHVAVNSRHASCGHKRAGSFNACRSLASATSPGALATLGGLPAAGDERVATGGWIRTAVPLLLDAPLVAAMTDAWAPAALVALGRFVAGPTLDLTIHLRRPLPVPSMAPCDYVVGCFRSGLSVAGVWEEDGELWSPGAELIAQSRQPALVRELPS
jgi:Thioesterase-like superfamily